MCACDTPHLHQSLLGHIRSSTHSLDGAGGKQCAPASGRLWSLRDAETAPQDVDREHRNQQPRARPPGERQTGALF